MANLRLNVAASEHATGTTAKTVLGYTAPASAGATVKRFGIQFKGTTPTDAPILVEALRGATSGTGTSVTPAKVSGHTGSAQGTAKENYSAEPSGGTVVARHLVHPQSGFVLPTEIQLNPAEQFTLRVTAGVSVSCVPSFDIEE